jgi:hypothetical protein
MEDILMYERLALQALGIVAKTFSPTVYLDLDM